MNDSCDHHTLQSAWLPYDRKHSQTVMTEACSVSAKRLAKIYDHEILCSVPEVVWVRLLSLPFTDRCVRSLYT